MVPVNDVLSYASLKNCVLTEEQRALALKYCVPNLIGEYSTVTDEQLTRVIGGEEKKVCVNGKNRKKIYCKICHKDLTNDKGFFMHHCRSMHKAQDELTINQVVISFRSDT